MKCYNALALTIVILRYSGNSCTLKGQQNNTISSKDMDQKKKSKDLYTFRLNIISVFVFIEY